MIEASFLTQKLLAALGTPIAKAVIRRPTTRIRVAFAVSRKSKDGPTPLTLRAVHRWLARADTADLLGHSSPTARASALANLKNLLPSSTTDEDIESALQLVLHQLLAASDPSKAVATSNEWHQSTIHAESARTRAEVADTKAALLARLDEGRTFEESLSSIHPWRADVARDLRSQSPAIETVMSALRSSDNKRDLLADYAQHRPAWLEGADPAVLCWLAELSSDHDGEEAALVFVNDALNAGAHPRGYWIGWRAQHMAQTDEQAALDGLIDAQDSHPFPTALQAALQGNHEDSLAALTNWEAQTRPERATRAALMARLHLALSEADVAIAGAERACQDLPEAAGLRLVTAEALLIRASRRETATKLSDAARALDYCLHARNARRAWGGDSAAAAVMAVRAANMAGDPDQAWRICTPTPDGAATLAEAADSRLLREAALTAALTRRAQQARSLVKHIQDPFAKLEVEAILADDEGNKDSAEKNWRAAYALADNPGDKLAAARGLATLGATLPDLSELKHDHGERVDEIRAIHRAMSASGDQLVALRASINESPQIVVTLAQLLTDEERHSEAGDALKHAADFWGHPTLMSMAAQAYYKAGRLQDARSSVQSSLNMGGATWSGARGALGLLLQISADQSDWALGAEAAQALVSLDGNDEEAQWALVKCLVQQAKYKEAWHALAASGESARPRDPDEARLWIQLHARYAPERRYLSDALEVLNDWQDTEEVVGTVIPALYLGLSQRGFTPKGDELARLHAVQADFQQTYPESRYFRAIPVGDDGEELGPLIDHLRATHEPAVDQILGKVRGGEVPLGMASLATGRSYAEAALSRAAGRVWSSEPTWRTIRSQTNFAQGAVIDTTAARTLVLLDPTVTDQLTGALAVFLTPDRLYRDAFRARDSLSLKSNMTLAWDPVAARPRAVELSDADSDRLLRDAEALVALLSRATRVSVPEFSRLPGDLKEDWLSGVELALERALPFWCDDRILRALAQSMGASTISTAEVLHARHEDGALTTPELEVAVGILVDDYQIDLGFWAPAMDHAGQMRAWKARGAAAAIARPSTWDEPDQTFSYLIRALQENAGRSPDDLSAWLAAGFTGLMAIASTPDQKESNLRVALERVFVQPFISQAEVPHVTDALRSVLASTDLPDPLPLAMTSLYRRLAESRDPAVAKSVLLWLFALCDDSVKRQAARTILTADLGVSLLATPGDQMG